MLTYSKIGHFGRLGNQMFQFAGVYGIARKLGYQMAFPEENVINGVIEHFKDGVARECTFDIPKAFKLKDDLLQPLHVILENIQNVVDEPHFHFTEEYFKLPDNCDFTGYFQSEKYFKHVESELKELFTFKDDIQETAKKLFPNVDSETVSIHVRLGDYTALQQFHPVCSSEYYAAAASHFTDKDYAFIIFSDDIEYCKEQLFGYDTNIHYIDNKDPYVDLCLMSMCDHNIIANSSFSWWAAWLNRNVVKRVIAPKRWFGPAYEQLHNTDDLYCQNWKRL